MSLVMIVLILWFVILITNKKECVVKSDHCRFRYSRSQLK